MADQEIKFKLDLDAVEFLEKGIQAKGVIQSIGSKENLTELLEGLTQTTAILGAVGIAAFSVKKAIDFTLEAESIQKVEKQFEILSEQAGISSTALKEGLEKSSKGLVDTSDLLEVANKKIVAMGGDASRLPEIMDLATKASQVFGGSVIQNFDEISTAIANGNTRMLKHKGILVDANKAVQDYATANNLAANELSEAGRRQAILNAALEQGKKAFAGVDVDLNTATNTLQLLKVTLKDLGEAFSLAFEKTMGPAVRSFLVGVKNMASEIKTTFQATFGEGLEQNSAQIKKVEANLKSLTSTLDQLKAKQGTKFDLVPGDTVSRIQAANVALKQTETELTKLKSVRQSLTKEEESGATTSSALGKRGVEEDKVNAAVRKQNATKLQQDLLKIDEAKLKASEKNIKTLDGVDQVIKAQAKIREQQHQLALQEIENSTHLNSSQKLVAAQAENISYQEKVQAAERDTANVRKKLLEEYVKNSTNAFDGISRSFQAHAEMAKADLKDMGKRGEEVFASIQKNSVSAFEAMGAAIAQGKNVAQAAGEAMLKIFLGVIADQAMAEGSKHLIAGLWPPNPVELGVGGGLVALGGALRSAAGGIGGSVGAPAGGGGGGGGSISSGVSYATEKSTAEKATNVTADQTDMLNQMSQRNADAEALQKSNITDAQAADQENQQKFAAAAAQAQADAAAAVAEKNQQASDQLAGTLATNLSNSMTQAQQVNPSFSQDQSLADTASQSSQRQKVVQIHIAGNYMETDQTRRQLMELIRQETDATDFTYNKIGV